ncbi:MAG: hypothetical protein LBJ12_03105 [Oscillospiraceae bacterium]|nr:hypothetical protein [Oscillospiraceae bacterium]
MDAVPIIPKMMTIREIARTGLLTEHSLRLLTKQGRLPALYINSKCLLDYHTVVEYSGRLAEENLKERRDTHETYR